MSFVQLPDPHPGRCRNYRPGNAGNESRRCLDYEGVPHVCTFPPEPPTRASTTWTDSVTVYTTPPPVPWEKPK